MLLTVIPAVSMWSVVLEDGAFLVTSLRQFLKQCCRTRLVACLLFLRCVLVFPMNITRFTRLWAYYSVKIIVYQKGLWYTDSLVVFASEPIIVSCHGDGHLADPSLGGANHLNGICLSDALWLQARGDALYCLLSLLIGNDNNTKNLVIVGVVVSSCCLW